MRQSEYRQFSELGLALTFVLAMFGWAGAVGAQYHHGGISHHSSHGGHHRSHFGGHLGGGISLHHSGHHGGHHYRHYRHRYHHRPYYGYRHRYHHRPYYRYRHHRYSYSRPYKYRHYGSSPHHSRSRSYIRYRTLDRDTRDHDSRDYPEAENTARDDVTVGTAWDTLASGRYEGALSQFGTAAERDPDGAIPKVGYALAAASAGNLDRGVWAMRRAFRIDPEGVEYLVLDEKSAEVARGLIPQYSGQEGASDHAFMLAALHYLLDAPGTASDYASAFAQESRPSAENLRELIEGAQRDTTAANEPESSEGAEPAAEGSGTR